MLSTRILKKAITTSLICCAILNTSLSYAEQPDSQIPKTNLTAPSVSQNLSIANFAADKKPSISDQVGDDIARQYAEYGISLLSDNIFGFNVIDPNAVFGKLFGTSDKGAMSSDTMAILEALQGIQNTLSSMIEKIDRQSDDLNLLITTETDYHTFTDLQKLKEKAYRESAYKLDAASANKLTKIAATHNGEDPTTSFYKPTAISALSANAKNTDIVDYLSDNPDKVSTVFGSTNGILSPSVVKAYNDGVDTLKANTSSDVLPMFLSSYEKNAYIQMESNVIKNSGDVGQFVRNANYYLIGLQRELANNIQIDYDVKRMVLRTYYYANQKDSPLYNVTIQDQDSGKEIPLRDYLWNNYISRDYVIDTSKIDIRNFTSDLGDKADQELSDEMTGKNSALDRMSAMFNDTFNKLTLTNMLTEGVDGLSTGSYTKYLDAGKTFTDKCNVVGLNDDQLFAQCYQDSAKTKPYPNYLGIDMAAANELDNNDKVEPLNSFSRGIDLHESMIDATPPHSFLYLTNLDDDSNRVTDGSFGPYVHFSPDISDKFKHHQLFKYIDYTQSNDAYEIDPSTKKSSPAYTADDLNKYDASGLRFQNSGDQVFDDASAFTWASDTYGGRSNGRAQGSIAHDSMEYRVLLDTIKLRTIKGTPIYYTNYFIVKTRGAFHAPVQTYQMTIGCLEGDDNCSSHSVNDMFTGKVDKIDGTDMPYVDFELGKIYDENSNFSVLGRTYQLQYQLDYKTDRGDGTNAWDLLLLIDNHLNLSGEAETNRIAGNFRDNCHVDSDGDIDYCIWYFDYYKEYVKDTGWKINDKYKDLTTYFLSVNGYIPSPTQLYSNYPWLDSEYDDHGFGTLTGRSGYTEELNDFDSYFFSVD